MPSAHLPTLFGGLVCLAFVVGCTWTLYHWANQGEGDDVHEYEYLYPGQYDFEDEDY
jgi:hypothetical protein